MPELLFEVGCEEIPAEDLFVLPEELKAKAADAFRSNRLPFSGLETHATPRRLLLHAELEVWQSELREQKMGPPVKIAIDAAGNPTPAGLGFAKNLGLRFEKLRTTTTPKGEYLCAEIVLKGKRTSDVLKEILPALVSDLPFRKFMKWGAGEFRFGRPIRNLLCLFDGKVVRIKIAGIRAGSFTFGHRFLGKKKIAVTSYADYRSQLAENRIVLSFTDRVEKIASELKQHAAAAGGVLKEDKELLHTMANEVEYPEVLGGSFSPEFLALPQEILMNAMRKHQKYFCALDENGHLLPVFFTVLNTRATKPELIRQGHERVLHARLRDAEFFWQEDLKTTLETRRPLLTRLTYQERLGTEDKGYHKRIERMLSIADEILRQLGLSELNATLNKVINDCKLDLLTSMVGEFPELQGVMAGLFAREEMKRNSSYTEDEWVALYDQYLPISAEDPLPRNLIGQILSLTDRIEALVTGYILNMIPTGSKDPYALRRLATGVVRIIIEKDVDLDLRLVFTWAVDHSPVSKAKIKPAEIVNGLLDLMEARFRFLMEQKGIAHDYLNAILIVEKKSFVAAQAKTEALWSKHHSGDLKTLARGFKRINNIIFDQMAHVFDAEALQEDGEIRLYRAFSDLEFRVEQCIQEEQYADALDVMVTLGPEIDNFFDEVLVMTEDENLRNNRIALLQKISELYRKLADFSALQIAL